MIILPSPLKLYNFCSLDGAVNDLRISYMFIIYFSKVCFNGILPFAPGVQAGHLKVLYF
jgi:hypothetical protein